MQGNRVYVRTATVGTGTATLGAVVSSQFNTFAESGTTDGQEVSSYIFEEGNDFEIGYGTYNSAGPTLTRNVRLSRIAGVVSTTAKMALAGTATVRVIAAKEDLRERLNANRTYYVRTDGSDSNTGSANTAGGAFLTIQKAVNTVFNTLDLNGYDVLISVGAGTYTGGVVASSPQVGAGTITIQGDIVTPTNVVISTTAAYGFIASNGAQLTVQGFKIQTTTSGWCIYGQRGQITFSALNFGACAEGHVGAEDHGVVFINGSYTISAGAVLHYHSFNQGLIKTPVSATVVVTLTGTPAFSAYFSGASDGGVQRFGTGFSFSGSATGPRHLFHTGAEIYSNSTSLTFFPGSVAGTLSDGGSFNGHQAFASVTISDPSTLVGIIAGRASFLANKGAVDQTGIASATFTKLTFTTEATDTGSFYDAPNSKWVPPAGVVMLAAQAVFTGGVVDQAQYTLAIYKNGVQIFSGTQFASGTSLACPSTFGIDVANGTDYYEVYTYAGGAGTKTVNGLSLNTYFHGAFLGG